MKWIKINNPPKNSNDVLLWEGKLGKHNGMLRAFYNQKHWWHYTVKGMCKKMPDDVVKKYSHWLDIQPPVFKRTVDLSGYKTKHKKGFTHDEIKTVLKDFPSIKKRDFNKAIGVVTGLVIKGDVVIYRHDIELAIRCCLEKRSININEFD
jgi:hypothetical protein